jgi:hypothetical protein
VGPAGPPIIEAPASLNPSDLDWWWQYGLDGLVGAVLGGIVTGAAVWFTIRHERRSVARDDLRASLAELQAKALQMTPTLIMGGNPEEKVRAAQDLFIATVRARGPALRVEPMLNAELDDFMAAWNEAIGPLADDDIAAARALTRELAARLHGWLGADNAGLKMSPASWRGASSDLEE